MLFIVDKVFNVLARPAELALLVLLTGVVLLLGGRRRLATSVLAMLAVAGLGLDVLPIDDWALYPLEARFPKPAALPACLRGIAILG
ncbi:hypothetical protein AB0067_28055, partial [Klebsiella pneumoniae]